MYNKLLENIVRTISNTAEVVKRTPVDPHSDFYNMMFAPEVYDKQLRRREKIEKIQSGVIAVVTGIAVIGEVAHIAKRRKRK